MEISSLFLIGYKINSVSKQTENLFSLLGFSVKKNDLLKISFTIGSDYYTLENINECKANIPFEHNINLIQFLNAYELIPQF